MVTTSCPSIITKQIEEDLKKRPQGQRWHLVAAITNKKPIAIATNDLHKSHPKTQKYNPLKKSHAEMRCINRAPKGKLYNSTITVVRWKGEQMRLAKPCDMCMAFIREAGIKKVIYSTNENIFAEIKL